MKGPPSRGAPPPLRSTPTPKVPSTTVHFRSGRTASIVAPEPAALQELWRAAHGERPGARWAFVRVALTERRGWPEREELVDLTAIESVVIP